MRFRAVLFDVHQTLIKKDYALLAAAQRNAAEFLQAEGYAVTLAQLEEAWERNRRQASEDSKKGEYDEVEFYGWNRSLLSLAGIAEPTTDLIDRFNHVFASCFAPGIEAMTGARETLDALRPTYALGVISNSLGRNTRLDLRVAGLYDYFTHIYMSSEVGKRKPHAAIFAAALAGLGMDAAQVVMVGDHPREDVAGARGAGMAAIHFAQAGKPVSPEATAVIHDLRELAPLLEQLQANGTIGAS